MTCDNTIGLVAAGLLWAYLVGALLYDSYKCR